MSIPPTRPSSTPPSKDGREDPEDKKVKKDFKLPEKKGKDEEKKKKGLFDIAGGEPQVKEMKPQVQQSPGDIKAEETSAIAAKAQVTQIGRLIQNMVAEMRVGQVDGKNFASMDLAKTAEVPAAFAGSNLTVSYQENGLVIRFDNFMSTQQEQNAFLLVEKNKEQLTEMMQQLQAKNIQVAELNIGNRTVSLPRVEPLPPPFRPAEPEGGSESRRERGGGGGRDQRQPGRGPGT